MRDENKKPSFAKVSEGNLREIRLANRSSPGAKVGAGGGIHRSPPAGIPDFSFTLGPPSAFDP
jgi:hypothetical protein